MNKLIKFAFLTAVISLSACDMDSHQVKEAVPILPFLIGGPKSVTVDFGGSIDRKTILISEICVDNSVYLVTSEGGITLKIGNVSSSSTTFVPNVCGNKENK